MSLINESILYCDECGFAVSYKNDLKDFWTAVDFHEDSLCYKPLLHSELEPEDDTAFVSLCDSHSYLFHNSNYMWNVLNSQDVCPIYNCHEMATTRGLLKIRRANE